MIILGDKRKKLIDNLNFNESLKKLAAGESVHDELDFRCLKLKYSLEPENFYPVELDVVPLWESDTSITGFYLDEKSEPVFIHYYVEDIDEYKVVGKSVADLVEFLVEEYVEYDFENEVRTLLLKSD
ncbi:hypothetical protein [Photobacterium atrarenae]|uniref:Uncharacterized protein n=1 Tax=Photobacterium atrarenae TaxID=865757 RepID=A0ABY5GD02_9GAMM|nr:hypothetical protein [Photobacterium atrarenae]UTV26472.1 hypothetical protein NNL38_08780 [Photobacterium atrarenae]